MNDKNEQTPDQGRGYGSQLTPNVIYTFERDGTPVFKVVVTGGTAPTGFDPNSEYWYLHDDATVVVGVLTKVVKNGPHANPTEFKEKIDAVLGSTAELQFKSSPSTSWLGPGVPSFFQSGTHVTYKEGSGASSTDLLLRIITAEGPVDGNRKLDAVLWMHATGGSGYTLSGALDPDWQPSFSTLKYILAH